MRKLIITLLLMLLPFGARAEVPPMKALRLPSVIAYRLIHPPNVYGTRLPRVQEIEPVPVPASGRVRLSDYNAPSPYWSMNSGLRISEAKAGAWEDVFKLRDDPNTAVIADTIDHASLKIVTAGPIGLRDSERLTNTVAIQSYLVDQKALGYNAVLFEWITGSMVNQQFLALVTWAAGEFDTIIVAPVPGGQTDNRLPTRLKTNNALNALLDQADVCLLGWGFTIDLVLYGDEGDEEFAKRFFRWAERRAAAKGVPVWGNLYTRFHGTDQKYQYTPANHTAYVCCNIAPQGNMVRSAANINAKIAAHGVPAGKPIILGPFHRGNMDKSVAIYNSLGYGAIKMEKK